MLRLELTTSECLNWFYEIAGKHMQRFDRDQLTELPETATVWWNNLSNSDRAIVTKARAAMISRYSQCYIDMELLHGNSLIVKDIDWIVVTPSDYPAVEIIIETELNTKHMRDIVKTLVDQQLLHRPVDDPVICSTTHEDAPVDSSGNYATLLISPKGEQNRLIVEEEVHTVEYELVLRDMKEAVRNVYEKWFPTLVRKNPIKETPDAS